MIYPRKSILFALLLLGLLVISATVYALSCPGDAVRREVWHLELVEVTRSGEPSPQDLDAYSALSVRLTAATRQAQPDSLTIHAHQSEGFLLEGPGGAL